jgi:CRP/FNR family transcriptional regulator, cyclic AMP receptor protein
MEDLDFSRGPGAAKPLATLAPLYVPAVARAFFESAGQEETIAAGTVLFSENEKASRFFLQRAKMYYLLEGEIELIAKGKPVGPPKVGEIFGEMAAIAHAPRSATAVAKTACRVIGLDDKQFRKALARKPGFALMLMSVIIGRLKETLARLKAADGFSDDDALEESAVFNPKLLADMVQGLSDDPPVSFLRDQMILKEDQVGTRMYAVIEGRISVSIGGKVVDRMGPGGVLGELAVLDPAPRLASAVAEDNATLQPITRNAFIALVKLDPELGVALLTALAERLRYLTERLK